MPDWARTTLGRTGLEVGRLGLAAGYGATVRMVERAFEHGINYLYWGSFRRGPYGEALRNLKPQRDRLALVIQSYSRIAALVPWSVERALRKIGYDHGDVLLLGLWNHEVTPRIFEAALRVRERGLVRHIAISTHKRALAPVLAGNRDVGIVHVRYNAAHTGAEKEIFPALPARDDRPGVVSFTATSWKRLLDPKRMPAGERTPTAADCYRFVLTHPDVDVCLTGPANEQQAEAAFEALAKGPMSGEELEWMRRVGAAVHG
jgi:aryl-alcohol dehydrogenase-like predicted oxidoreductase